ncbi:MAG: phasin family protein, partial [Dokdonella sp.]
MAFDAKIPMSMYKANLELVMRLGALLHESRQRWTRFGLGGADSAIEKTLNETGRMLTTNDWQSLAALPGATFWKALQGDAGPMQGAIDTAMTSQAAFIEGV